MFSFWYRFILNNSSAISRGATDYVYGQIEPQLSNYMGKIFEEICSQYLWKLLIKNQCPIKFTSLGRWWGNDPVNKCQTEIDIMGEQDSNTALFAECKWRNELTDKDTLDSLINKGKLFHYSNNYYFLFSKSGFTDNCKKEAKKMGNVALIKYGEMVP